MIHYRQPEKPLWVVPTGLNNCVVKSPVWDLYDDGYQKKSLRRTMGSVMTWFI
jgi:hypothetical protein